MVLRTGVDISGEGMLRLRGGPRSEARDGLLRNFDTESVRTQRGRNASKGGWAELRWVGLRLGWVGPSLFRSGPDQVTGLDRRSTK